jgi:hypothetical protein
VIAGIALPGGRAEAPPASDAVEAGRALAAELRSQQPQNSATNTAFLKIRDGEGRRRVVPVKIAAETGGDAWTVTYVATTSKGGATTVLSVRHQSGQPPAYTLSNRGEGQTEAPVGESLRPGSAFVAFAGSDFWVADLGLEFLHWPGQRLLRSEQFAGRPSRVLESVNPDTNGYARVVSYIDAEYHGLLGAEAFDPKGQLMKRFFADSFKKVGDTWMLKDMKIRDVRTDSLTELEFELPK